MKQTSSLTQTLTDAQVDHATAKRANASSVAFRLYTEQRLNLRDIVTLYFPGATLFPAAGLWHGQTEPSTVIEVIAPASDVAQVRALADHIRKANAQDCVILTSQALSTLDFVTE